MRKRCHPDTEGIQGLASKTCRDVTQTLKEYQAWPAYPPEVPRQWRNSKPGQNIQQRRDPDIGGIRGLASISSRGVTQTLEKYETWTAYPAEVSPRHWKNKGPGQHIQLRCHPDMGEIQMLWTLRIDGHLKRASSHNKSHELETFRNRHGKSTTSES